MTIHQSKRVFVDSNGETMGSVHYVSELLEQCGSCRVFDKAPHIPIAGSFPVQVFIGKLKVDPLAAGDGIASHATDVYSKNSPVIPARSKKPQKFWGVFAACGFLFLEGRSASKRAKEVK